MSSDTEFGPLLLTITEAAAALRLSKGTIKKLIRFGDLDSVKIGASRRIPADAVEDYVKHLKEQAANAAASEHVDRSAA
jgi:excisionase family DNA binding protein